MNLTSCHACVSKTKSRIRKIQIVNLERYLTSLPPADSFISVPIPVSCQACPIVVYRSASLHPSRKPCFPSLAILCSHPSSSCIQSHTTLLLLPALFPPETLFQIVLHSHRSIVRCAPSITTCRSAGNFGLFQCRWMGSHLFLRASSHLLSIDDGLVKSCLLVSLLNTPMETYLKTIREEARACMHVCMGSIYLV